MKLGNPNGAAAIRRAGKGNKEALKAVKAEADRHAADLVPVFRTFALKGVRRYGNSRRA